MFGKHRHEWHQISSKVYEEDRQHGTFIKTIYYHIEECCKCGEQRKAIYNAWIHKPISSETENDVMHRADHAMIMWIEHREYEKISEMFVSPKESETK